jgi:hypothetical protein
MEELRDEQWAGIGAVDGDVPVQRQDEIPRPAPNTIEMVIWRHQNEAKCCSIPDDLRPWCMGGALRWVRLGRAPTGKRSGARC